MTEKTTINLPASKRAVFESIGHKRSVWVGIDGVNVGGSGATLADAKASAVANLLELAANQQNPPAVTVERNGDDTIIRVFYPHGTASESLTIHVPGHDGDGIRVGCSASHAGIPDDRASVLAGSQPDTRKVY